MEIRKAQMIECDIVLHITQKTIQEIYPHYYAPGAVAFFLHYHTRELIEKDIQDGTVFLLMKQLEPIGTITIKGNEICRLFILPDVQKQGFGTKLMTFAEEKIAQSYHCIKLDASLPAKSMYLKRGYIPDEVYTLLTEQEDFLSYDVMIKFVNYTRYKIDYEGRIFKTQDNSENGEVSSQTIFHYHQQGDLLWAEYAGGAITKGYLIGIVHPNGELTFTYQHVNGDQQLRTGKCNSTPHRLENGKLVLFEQWKWLDGDKSEGSSTLVEL